MKKGYLFFVFIAAMPVFLSAQKAVRFEVQASSDTIFLGHYFKVTFTLENAKGSRFTPPEFGAEVEVMSGPNTSSSISVINGETSQKQSYSYLLRPTDTGVLHILPATIETEEGILETAHLDLKVLPNDRDIPQPAVDRRSDIFRMDFGDSINGFPMPRTAPEETMKKKRKTVKI